MRHVLPKVRRSTSRTVRSDRYPKMGRSPRDRVRGAAVDDHLGAATRRDVESGNWAMILANVGSVCIIGQLARLRKHRRTDNRFNLSRSGKIAAIRLRHARRIVSDLLARGLLVAAGPRITAAGFPGSVGLACLPKSRGGVESANVRFDRWDATLFSPRASDCVFADLFTIRLGRTPWCYLPAPFWRPAQLAHSYGVNVIAV
jgi:hypothetical protein